MDTLFYFPIGCLIGAVCVVICYLFGMECPVLVGSTVKGAACFMVQRLTNCDVSLLRSSTLFIPSDSSSFSFVPNHGIGSAARRSLYGRNDNEIKNPLMTQRCQSPHSAGSTLSPERLTVMCQLAMCHEDEEDYVVRNCHLVMSESFMMLYEVLSSHSVGNHERAITNERFIGRIQMDRVVSRAIYVSSADKRSLRTGGLHGHMLMLTTHSGDDGLFFEAEDGECGIEEEDPSLGVTVRGSKWWDASSKTLHEVMLGRRRSSGLVGVTKRDESVEKLSNSASLRASVGGHGENSCSDHVGGGSPWDEDNGSEEPDPDAKGTSQMYIFLKFRYAREQERVHNLLVGMHEAVHWHEYLQTIPTPNAFNVFLSRVIFQSLRSTALANFIREKIQKSLDIMAVKKFPRGLEGRILLDDVALNSEVPVISNVTDPLILAKGEMMFDLDMLYRGGASLLFRSCLTYRGVRIPHVTLYVKLVRAEARLRVSVGPPPSKVFWVGCLAPPDVQLEVSQGMESGHGLLHRLLTSLPNLSGIVTKLLKLYLLHEMMLPLMDDFPLPNVEDTPPVTPRDDGKKTWNVPFCRREAMRYIQEHMNIHWFQEAGDH